ncbi:hypothetical protein BTURTLESOX_1632 [bacterium endosymbiont of Bathymodiolus sp. 5 South]|jgi:hypothetical protein|nr:hypothetical protein [uncultured Gammaproteobacteria bacterium]SSC07181.1 hypothetical protein BTURTLESOX_1632 [bacterium endosymbiont of Bathymodiolus sp. 5 South]VVM24469.1 hypothetical protein BSPWISOXPB_8001 [uncultured Gammaproteobacteria bacterium]
MPTRLIKIFKQLWLAFMNLIQGKDRLFDGDDEVFKKSIQDIDYYGEYGMGRSTIWVIGNTRVKKVFAVDTSKVWLEKVRSNLNHANVLTAKWVDLGRLAKWGIPIDYSKRECIINYVESIWKHEQKPQFVLVDGRFRVACFLYYLATGAPGTKIVFDDYVNRPHYHLIEEFVEPNKTCGRQCMFVVPEKVDKEKIMNLMRQFLFVME